MIGIGKSSGFYKEFQDYFGSYIIGFVTIFTEAIRRLHHSVVFLNEFRNIATSYLNIIYFDRKKCGCKRQIYWNVRYSVRGA